MFSKSIVCACALVGALAVISSVAAAADDTFIKEAIQGNLAEVKVGQLAQQKGASQGVKDFGAALVSDHQAANQMAMQVAQQMNITPPEKPGIKQTAVYNKLARLSGEQFDREFVNSMVKDHKEDISKYEQESRQSGPAAEYAKKTLPKLHEHLKMADDLEEGTRMTGGSQSSKMK